MAKLPIVYHLPRDEKPLRDNNRSFHHIGHSGLIYFGDFEASRQFEERQRFRVNRQKVYQHHNSSMPPPYQSDLTRHAHKTSPERNVRYKPNLNRNNRQQSPTRHMSPERKTNKAHNINNHLANKQTSPQLQSPQLSAARTPPTNIGRSNLYPTLSTFYDKENLDYSPPEPTADYPYSDDLPTNNIYPDINTEIPRRNIVEGLTDNTVEHNLNIFHKASNLNINIPESKVLNDKRLDLNESIVDNEVQLTDETCAVIPSAPPITLIATVPPPNAPVAHVPITSEDLVRPNRNSFQKKCDASKFLDENTPLIKLADQRAPIKMSYADRKSQLDINNPPKSKAEFEQWMTWRKQVNRHMASMILIKQGKDVYVAASEVNRKPLPKETMQSVIHKSKDNTKQTSLDGKPYVMYGIPRAKILG